MMRRLSDMKATSVNAYVHVHKQPQDWQAKYVCARCPDNKANGKY